MSRKEAESLQW